jgi:hypothetical protein
MIGRDPHPSAATSSACVTFLLRAGLGLAFLATVVLSGCLATAAARLAASRPVAEVLCA